MEKGKATICIVNYRTLELTRLCLRSLRKFTRYPYQVLVIDNGSKDASTQYLRSLKWIRLIERDSTDDPSGGYSHAAALQLGLESTDTEFFISMHSDTFVIRDNWLCDLIAFFKDDSSIACVGAGKVELAPGWRLMLKKYTDYRTFFKKLLRLPDPRQDLRYYNRTICSIYRTQILKNEKLTFLDTQTNYTAGKKLYFDLLDKGYKTVELSDRFMADYILHLAHATQFFNPEIYDLRPKTMKKCDRTIRKILSSDLFKQLSCDTSLDN